VFLRDAYLQRRRNLIYDGSPPREKREDEEPEAPVNAPASQDVKGQDVKGKDPK
jgi:phospholipid-binding lipoprotein MlaA